VEDVNDLAPQFTNVPTGNTLYVRTALTGNDVVGRVGAEDSDGTKPGNIVMFDLDVDSSSEAVDQYFRLDQSSGEIILLGDLSNEVYDQYKLTIRAFDQGTPSLSSSVDVMIRVEQVVTLPPNTGIGFKQLKHAIQALENTPQEAVLKTLPLTGIPKKNIRIRCSVRSAVDASGRNVDYLFKGEMDGNEGCNLVLARSSLDFEVMKEYRVEMEINTLTAFLNPQRAVADVVVEVVDKNDNSPVFVYDEEYHDTIKNKYIATIRLDTQVGAEIVQVKAKDLDSANLGKVHFEISSETATPYFKINPETGIISTNAAFDQSDISQDDLPFRLAVIARDNPGFMSDSKMTRTEVVINVLLRDNIFILVLKGQSPNQIRPRHDELAKIMSEPTDLIVNIDRSVPMLSKDENGTCCTVSQTDTDVWFYALDPVEQKLLSANSPVTQDKLTGKQAQTSLKYIVTGDFHVQASDVHSVFDETPTTATTSTSTTALKNLPPSQYSTGYPAVLIAIGCLVFACSFAAILYLLLLYTRYKRAKDHSERMVVIPRYEPVFVEPNLKQYETQVLQMSVNIDDIDNGLAVDFRNRNYLDPGFNLDNVSYITHETNSTSGSPVQDPEPSHSTFRGPSTPSFRAATISGRPGRPITRSQSNHNSSVVEGTASANPAFQDDQNLLFHGRADFNTSTPKHSHSFKTPRDATTQL